MAGGFGGGGAWTKDQEDIYWHAKGLGIGDVPHPYGPDMEQNTSDDLTKSQWRDFTERLNAAKEKATAGGTRDFVLGATDAQKKRSSDWYKTPEGAGYAESLGLPSGFGIRDGGGGGGGSSAPYASNPFFPQLVQDYTPPGLLDWSEYMPAGGLFGYDQYQPWINPNNIPSNIFNYQPPRIHAGGYGSTGVYPIGSYPTGGYPTGGYPTGGYPTGGYPTGGYPTGYIPTESISTESTSTSTPEYDPNKDPGWDEPGGSADAIDQSIDMSYYPNITPTWEDNPAANIPGGVGMTSARGGGWNPDSMGNPNVNSSTAYSPSGYISLDAIKNAVQAEPAYSAVTTPLPSPPPISVVDITPLAVAQDAAHNSQRAAQERAMQAAQAQAAQAAALAQQRASAQAAAAAAQERAQAQQRANEFASAHAAQEAAKAALARGIFTENLIEQAYANSGSGNSPAGLLASYAQIGGGPGTPGGYGGVGGGDSGGSPHR